MKRKDYKKQKKSSGKRLSHKSCASSHTFTYLLLLWHTAASLQKKAANMADQCV